MMTVDDIQSPGRDTAKLVEIICYYWRPMSIFTSGDTRYEKLKQTKHL